MEDKVEAILKRLLTDDYSYKNEGGGWRIIFNGIPLGLLTTNMGSIMVTGPIHPKFIDIVETMGQEMGISPEIGRDEAYYWRFDNSEDKTTALNFLLENFSLIAIEVDTGWMIRQKHFGVFSELADFTDRTNLAFISKDLSTIKSEHIGSTLWWIVALEIQRKWNIEDIGIEIGLPIK